MEEGNDKFYEAVASVLLRVTSLEKVLIDKGVISKEDYMSVLNESVKQLQKVTQQIVADNSRNGKMLS